MDTNQANLAEEISGQILTFTSGNSKYAFNLLDITDIIEIPEITPIPLVADHICGVINFRGKVVPVMDFNKRMRFDEFEYDNRSCIIILEINTFQIGIKVERVCDSENYTAQQFVKSPLENSAVVGYITINGERITLINCTYLTESDTY